MSAVYQLSKLRPLYRERVIITSEKNDLSRLPDDYRFKLRDESWTKFSELLLRAIVNYTGSFHEDVIVHLDRSRESEILREHLGWASLVRLFDPSTTTEEIIADYRQRYRLYGIQYRFDLA